MHPIRLSVASPCSNPNYTYSYAHPNWDRTYEGQRGGTKRIPAISGQSSPTPSTSSKHVAWSMVAHDGHGPWSMIHGPWSMVHRIGNDRPPTRPPHLSASSILAATYDTALLPATTKSSNRLLWACSIENQSPRF